MQRTLQERLTQKGRNLSIHHMIENQKNNEAIFNVDEMDFIWVPICKKYVSTIKLFQNPIPCMFSFLIIKTWVILTL